MANNEIESSPLLPSSLHLPHPTPRTVSRLITRIQALTLALLPIQVDLDELESPVSSILTEEVIQAYQNVGGDFQHVVPFALLEARRWFRIQAVLNPSDSDENVGRKLACEALARKLISRLKLEEQYKVLSERFVFVDEDEERSLPTSAIECAIDQQATFFLSSNESQRCVFALWRGLLIQKENEDGNIEYVKYEGAKQGGVVDHFDPARLGVPRYQFFFRISLWLIFVVAYTTAIQTPDRGFGTEDIILYIQVLGYILEDLIRIYKIGSWAAIGFWTIVNFMIYTLLLIAFGYRIADLSTSDQGKSEGFRLLSFQFLSSASPLIWMKLLTIFDLFQYFGTLQIVTYRMLKESAVFFTLLGLMAIGFGQALTGLDVADSSRQSTESVVHSLIQGLLGSPVFELYERGTSSYPFGMVLYYSWSVLTLVILLNILVALFGSAYQDCTDEAVPTFLGFFSAKTIAAIRAPDTYVYVAPFNLVEVIILPLEFVVSKQTYATINKYLMSVLFFVPLCCIALFETHFDRNRQRDLLALTEDPAEYTASDEDPEPFNELDSNLVISKVKFEDLKKRLPKLDRSVEGEILWEVKRLYQELGKIREEISNLKK